MIEISFLVTFFGCSRNYQWHGLSVNTKGCHINNILERNGSVVELLTRDQEAVGLSLTGVTVLWSFSKTHLS